jgi:hypothetical protein
LSGQFISGCAASQALRCTPRRAADFGFACNGRRVRRIFRMLLCGPIRVTVLVCETWPIFSCTC